MFNKKTQDLELIKYKMNFILKRRLIEEYIGDY